MGTTSTKWLKPIITVNLSGLRYGPTSTKTLTVWSNDMKRTNSWKSWTDEEIEQVDFLVRGGATAKEIAGRMEGRTENAVTYIIYSKPDVHMAWKSRQRVRAARRKLIREANVQLAPVIASETNLRTEEAKEDNSPITSNLSEIASVASAVFSFVTFLLVVGALLA
jgi:hypothetical protein